MENKLNILFRIRSFLIKIIAGKTPVLMNFKTINIDIDLVKPSIIRDCIFFNDDNYYTPLSVDVTNIHSKIKLCSCCKKYYYNKSTMRNPLCKECLQKAGDE